jgi:hypothetical protein
LAVLIGVANASPVPGDMASLLPAAMHGWEPQGQDGAYTSETLYELIDGGAEVYRSFNVKRVLSRRYGKEGAAEIIVDLFDMGSSRDAFGAYHHDLREGPDAGIGQESELLGSNLAFWKDRFFVYITPFAESDESRRAVLEMGKAIADAIPRPGERPDLVALLPPTGLITSQVHYFHDWVWLNRHYSFSHGNLLHLDRQTEGVLARYRVGSAHPEQDKEAVLSLLLVRYPSPEKARKARQSFVAGYLPDADAGGMARTETTGWTSVRAMGDLLMAVLDAPSKGVALNLLNEVEKTTAQ